MDSQQQPILDKQNEFWIVQAADRMGPRLRLRIDHRSISDPSVIWFEHCTDQSGTYESVGSWEWVHDPNDLPTELWVPFDRLILPPAYRPTFERLVNAWTTLNKQVDMWFAVGRPVPIG